MQSMVRRYAINTVAAVLAVLVATGGCSSGGGGGCGGGGCDGMGKLDRPFPKDQMMNRPAQIRLSQAAFTFLSSNYDPIIKMFLPGGLEFPVPVQDVKFDLFGEHHIIICQNGCVIKGTVRQLTFPMVEPDQLTAWLKIDISGVITIENDILLDKHCDVNITVKGKDVSAKVTFKVDPPTGLLSFDVSDINVELSEKDFDFVSCGVLLGTVDFLKPLLMNTVNDLIKTQIDSLLRPQLDTIRCLKCDYYAKGCPNGYTCSDKDPSEGFCQDKDGACAANPLGIAGKLDIGSLLASVSPGLSAVLSLEVAAGQFDQPPQDKIVNSYGLSLSMIAGMDAAANRCVPETEPPAAPAEGIPEAPMISATDLCRSCDPKAPSCPAGSECKTPFNRCMKSDYSCPTVPFMAGIAIHEHFLNQAFWTAFNAGALCISIGTSTVDMLSSGLFGLLIPEMSGVLVDEFNAHNGTGSAPVLLALRPQKAPFVRIGSGFSAFDNGTAMIVKPNLTVEIKDLSIDFYALVYERYTRMFTLTTDIILPVALDVVPSEENPGMMALLPVLDDIFGALQNMRATNTEMLGTTPEEIEAVFGTKLKEIVSPLLGGALGSLFKPIDLPAIQGFNLDILGVKGMEFITPYSPQDCSDRDLGIVVSNFSKDEDKNWIWKKIIAPTCDHKFLSVFANLAIAKAGAAAAAPQLKGPASVGYGISGSGITTPFVDVELEGAGGLEYSYRVDGGAWRMFRPASSLRIEDPSLLNNGSHKIDIRSRVTGKPSTTDLAGLSFEVVTDTMPPKLRTKADGAGGVMVEAADWVTQKDRIAVEYSLNGGDWIRIENGAAIPSSVLSLGRVDIRAADEAGRVSTMQITGAQTAEEGGSATRYGQGGVTQANPSGCSCALVGLD